MSIIFNTKMNTVGLVIQREYISRVRKKSFIILTLLMPLLMVALSVIPFWLSTLNEGGVKKIAVIDNTGIYAPLLQSTDNYDFQVIGSNKAKELESQLGKEYYAILQITGDLNKNPQAVSITSEKQTPQDLQSHIKRTLNEKVTQQKLDELTASGEVDAQAINRVRSIVESGSNVSLKTLRLGDDGSVSESSTELSTIIGMIFTILIYMFILMYGNMVMQAVLEEKKSRIVEVMVSSVKPVNLLIGKVVGIGLVGITQLIIWGILLGVLFSGLSFFIASPDQAAAMSADMGDFNMEGLVTSIMGVNWFEIGIFFLIFFIGGCDVCSFLLCLHRLWTAMKIQVSL